jgi:hypothetical protein
MIVPMLSPSIGATLFGLQDFQPTREYRYAMALAASLMAGWTALLLWADRRPVERRAVLLLTICPVLLGLMAAGAYAVASGAVPPENMLPTWALQLALIILFGASYRRGAPS